MSGINVSCNAKIVNGKDVVVSVVSKLVAELSKLIIAKTSKWCSYSLF